MAERRMFTKKITDSDAFLDMPASTQALYFHLNMSADDDGFVNNPKKIQRMVGANDDDLKLLIAKSFIITFESGVIVIKHWRMHNYVRNDRYKPTDYIEEKSFLSVKQNNAYTLDVSKLDTVGIPNGNQMATKCLPVVSVGKDRLGKVRKGKVSLGKDNILCSEPEQVLSHEPAVISLILNDKSEFPITKTMINDWKELYQAVDILQELKKMKGWLDSNPAKRKTKKGVPRFINSWLAREQDRGGTLQKSNVGSNGNVFLDLAKGDDVF